MNVDPVETFVFLPYSKYKALDIRAKKVEPCNSGMSALENDPAMEKRGEMSVDLPLPISNPEGEKKEEEKPRLGRDLTKTYRSVQIKKLLTHLEKTRGSEGITSLPNLDDPVSYTHLTLPTILLV